MKTKEAEKNWGYSQTIISKMCKNNIIPLAEKNRGKWYIPDNQTKPPFTTLKKYYTLMNWINLSREGVKLSNSKLGGLDIDDIKAGYRYLIDYLFITEFDINNLDDIVNSNITSDGKALMDIYEKQLNKKASNIMNKTQVKAGGGINLGIVNGNLEISQEHTSELV